MTQIIIVGFVAVVGLGFAVSTIMSWLEHRKTNSQTDVRTQKEHQNIDLWASKQKNRKKGEHGP